MDQAKKKVSKKLYRGPIQLLAGGCLKFWRVGDPMLLGPVSSPHLTLNVSSSDYCQRLIFELPPTVLDGIVTATNIAGVKRKLFRDDASLLRVVTRDGFIFRIVLLSQA